MIKKIKWKGKASDKVIVCPRCGSTHLTLSSKMDAWLTPRKYLCKDCGYVGPIVLEIEKDQLKKRKRKNERITQAD